MSDEIAAVAVLFLFVGYIFGIFTALAFKEDK